MTKFYERMLASEAWFVALIGDVEKDEGLMLYPAGARPVRAFLQFFGHTKDGRPAAFYQVPAQERVAMVVADTLLRTLSIADWIERDEAHKLAGAVAEPTKRHRKRVAVVT